MQTLVIRSLSNALVLPWPSKADNEQVRKFTYHFLGRKINVLNKFLWFFFFFWSFEDFNDMFCLHTSLRMLCNAVDNLVHIRRSLNTRLNLSRLLCLGMGGSVSKPSQVYRKC